MSKRKVIAIVNEFEGDSDLLFFVDNKETPQTLFDYITENLSDGRTVEIKVYDIDKKNIADPEDY